MFKNKNKIVGVVLVLGLGVYKFDNIKSFFKCLYHSKVAEYYIFRQNYQKSLEELSKITDENPPSHIDKGN